MLDQASASCKIVSHLVGPTNWRKNKIRYMLHRVYLGYLFLSPPAHARLPMLWTTKGHRKPQPASRQMATPRTALPGETNPSSLLIGAEVNYTIHEARARIRSISSFGHHAVGLLAASVGSIDFGWVANQASQRADFSILARHHALAIYDSRTARPVRASRPATEPCN